jgi:hypothetical protein
MGTLTKTERGYRITGGFSTKKKEDVELVGSIVRESMKKKFGLFPKSEFKSKNIKKTEEKPAKKTTKKKTAVKKKNG